MKKSFDREKLSSGHRAIARNCECKYRSKAKNS